MALLPLLHAILALAAPVPGREAAAPPGMRVTLSDSETAVFAGGNFWSLQRHFDFLRRKGVVSTMTGYTGGTAERPTYQSVGKGDTGHREAVQVVFNPRKITFAKLVEDFLRQTDPFDGKGQFCDEGYRFRSAIYFESEKQRKTAENVIRRLEKKLGKGRFTTELLPARPFHAAESLHQEFYSSNSVSYKLYVFGCGREERLEKVWGRPHAHR